MFTPGKSGNIHGRPVGVPDRRSKLRKMIESDSKELIGKAVRLAKNGDQAMLTLLINKIVPTPKGESVPIKIPLDASSSPAAQSKNLFSAISGGKISIEDAVALMGILMQSIKIQEATELESRLKKLEERVSRGNR